MRKNSDKEIQYIYFIPTWTLLSNGTVSFRLGKRDETFILEIFLVTRYIHQKK